MESLIRKTLRIQKVSIKSILPPEVIPCLRSESPDQEEAHTISFRKEGIQRVSKMCIVCRVTPKLGVAHELKKVKSC